jgi:hypothetical protein
VTALLVVVDTTYAAPETTGRFTLESVALGR